MYSWHCEGEVEVPNNACFQFFRGFIVQHQRQSWSHSSTILSFCVWVAYINCMYRLLSVARFLWRTVDIMPWHTLLVSTRRIYGCQISSLQLTFSLQLASDKTSISFLFIYYFISLSYAFRFGRVLIKRIIIFLLFLFSLLSLISLNSVSHLYLNCIFLSFKILSFKFRKIEEKVPQIILVGVTFRFNLLSKVLL